MIKNRCNKDTHIFYSYCSLVQCETYNSQPYSILRQHYTVYKYWDYPMYKKCKYTFNNGITHYSCLSKNYHYLKQELLDLINHIDNINKGRIVYV